MSEPGQKQSQEDTKSIESSVKASTAVSSFTADSDHGRAGCTSATATQQTTTELSPTSYETILQGLK